MKKYFSPLAALCLNILLAYGAFAVAHVAYALENYSYFAPAFSFSALPDLLVGTLRFDTSGMVYVNMLYAILMLFPLWLKENDVYHRFCRVVFVVLNGIAFVANMADAVYFRYTLRRTTSTVFKEFAGEDNLVGIFAIEILRHWYLLLLSIAVIYLLWRLYTMPKCNCASLRPIVYFATGILVFAAVVGLSIAGMRGGFTRATRPITLSNANQYVSRPVDAALILNTPFTIIRTIGKKVFVNPHYFRSEEELSRVYTPWHTPTSDSISAKRRNVVVLIVESFGREYIGSLNKTLENGTYKGYTPFADSLISQSLTFKYSFANGHKSIDGMPSILSGIPMMIEPFFVTPAALNKVGGLAATLGAQGYQTAFFHGAQRGSMGFQAFARATGFADYYGREDFCADPRTRGDEDFDGNWAIWDEPFLQYYAMKMNDMHEPFMTAVFTASSHHPFVVPADYEALPSGTLSIHKCIRYTDNALRQFFAYASRQPWYENTLFVLTSDHTNMTDHEYYMTDLGGFSAPVVFFDPQHSLFQPAIQDKVAQQTDIMPTVLGLLGNTQPYLAFGCDLMTTPPDSTFAVSYTNGVYQYVKNGYVIQYDGVESISAYLLTDSLMKNKVAPPDGMLTELKAIIEQYMMRMVSDRLMSE